MKSFDGKQCVVTGAGNGIGRAVALDLARRGSALALSDKDEAGLAQTRELIGASDNRHRYDTLDVSDSCAIDAYAAMLKTHWGASDYLFNIAGLSRIGDFFETPKASYEIVMNVNFYGTVNMTRAILPQIIETKGGIINISSLFGLIGFPGQTHYCASKFAVRGFSESLAMEMTAHGVTVTCVHPGGVATDITRKAEMDSLPPGMKSREKINKRFDKAARTSPESAARTIINGAARGKRRVIVGGDAHFLSFVQRLFPRGYQLLIEKATDRR